jgi:signal transduction histidine kinase
MDESRLEQLIGVHSSKTGYYAQWRGTRRDLERAFDALRSMSEALCVTALGPAPLCDAVLDAVGRLFDAEWAALILDGQGLPATVPSRFTWSRPPVLRETAPSAQESAALAAQIGPAPRVLAGEGAARRAAVLGVPMRLDRKQVGALLIGLPNSADPDRTGMAILETVANQIMAALRNACLFADGEELRQQAVAGWTEAERRASELAMRNEQLRRARGQLARARQAELVSAERHRIARDLHDGVAQGLVGIGMHLEWCQRHLDAASPVYDRLLAGKELARGGLIQVRSAVAELSDLEHPGTGLAQALRDLATDFRSAGPLRVSVRVSGPRHQLPPEVEHSLFQIAQEGLWNVVRHAGAARAWLDLRYRPGQTRLSISDDGTGDPAAASRYLAAAARPRGRHGLRNMVERTAELGGEVRVQRRRGGGLRIGVQVPDAS